MKAISPFFGDAQADIDFGVWEDKHTDVKTNPTAKQTANLKTT
jgi:hypothetical protein